MTVTDPAATALTDPPRRSRGEFHPLPVAAVERLTDDAVAITFEVPDELRDAYAFSAGQHVTVRTEVDGVDVRRSYSICAPATSGVLRIGVKRLQGGAFSVWANDVLRPGDVVDVMTPTGRFGVPFDPSAARHYVALAAGSGITPVLSIAATALEVEPYSRVTIVLGNRTSGSILFLEELEDLKNRWPSRVQLLHVLTREAQEAALLSGRIDSAKVEALLSTLVPPDDVDAWLLCGPYAMVEGARGTLLAAGVDASAIHTELFHVEDAPPVRATPEEVAAAGMSRVTVQLDGRTTVLDVPRTGESVLDALLRVRRDAPYACKGGVCGTCRGRVVEGEVKMTRSYALEPAEIDAGFVLPCQSAPVSDSVVLDLDA